MSHAPRLLHPGFLRKVAVICILGGLVIAAALFGLRTIPVMLGAAEWAGLPHAANFIPLVDGLFVLGIVAHVASMLIVIRDRNPGLVRFVRRSFSGRSGRVQVVPPSANEPVEYSAGDEWDTENLGETGEPADGFGERFRAGWGALRASMSTRRGAAPHAPTRPENFDDDATRVIPRLGSSEPGDQERDDHGV